jgi:hypothetical protein
LSGSGELASFPHGTHDDQVNSEVQFLAAVDTGDLSLRATVLVASASRTKSPAGTAFILVVPSALSPARYLP